MAVQPRAQGLSNAAVYWATLEHLFNPSSKGLLHDDLGTMLLDIDVLWRGSTVAVPLNPPRRAWNAAQYHSMQS